MKEGSDWKRDRSKEAEMERKKEETQPLHHSETFRVSSMGPMSRKKTYHCRINNVELLDKVDDSNCLKEGQ